MRLPEEADGLEPEIASACANWLITLMSERKGKGVDVFKADGSKLENSWVLDDVITEIDRVCPDVVARLLQAGAAAYIQETRTCPTCEGSGKGKFVKAGYLMCEVCGGNGKLFKVG